VEDANPVSRRALAKPDCKVPQWKLSFKVRTTTLVSKLIDESLRRHTGIKQRVVLPPTAQQAMNRALLDQHSFPKNFLPNHIDARAKPHLEFRLIENHPDSILPSSIMHDRKLQSPHMSDPVLGVVSRIRYFLDEPFRKLPP